MPRPFPNITKEQFQKLCELQCSQAEMCRFFNTTDKTLTKWCKENYNMPYKECFAVFREGGLVCLRRYQWSLAEKNAAMAIWLGKQHLAQKDSQVLELEKKVARLEALLEMQLEGK